MNEWLNYHHLRYFWAVVVEGGVGKAAERLHVAQPTVSRQIHELEEALGVQLLERKGRGLQLTRAGEEVFERAEQIMGLGQEILSLAHTAPGGAFPRFRAGVVNALPKWLAYRALEPATRQPELVKLEVDEGELGELIDLCTRHKLDVVLSDAPPPVETHSKLRVKEVIESPVGLFASGSLARMLRKEFPESMNGMPILLPAAGTSLRRTFEEWVHLAGITPVVAGEFADLAMLKVFARNSAGVFPAPMAIEEDLTQIYGFEAIAELPSSLERVHAIYMETNPLPHSLEAILERSTLNLVAATE